MHKTITFRSQTMGVVHDLIRDEGLTCPESQNLISHLAGELLSYREEGIELTPTILYCQDATILLRSFPGSLFYELGTTTLSSESIKQILKDCAPLSTTNWQVFVERTDDHRLRYGVFRYLMRPTTLPLHETISAMTSPFALVIRKTSNSTVELHGSKGHSISLSFSTARDDTPASDALQRFCIDCISSISAGSERDEFLLYLQNVMARTLTASHGTIMICGDPMKLEQLENLRDHIPLKPPLSLYKPFSDYKRLDDADTFISLISTEELLQGFINSDGMVALDREGNIFAYRAFYKGGSDVKVVGGARRRAFEGLKEAIGGPVQSALFRSQDGYMLYAGKDQ